MAPRASFFAIGRIRWLGCALALSAACLAASASAANLKSGSKTRTCVFDLSPAEEPYYVLGTLVRPQSNYIAVADCNKTLEQIKETVAAQARARARSETSVQLFRGAGGPSSPRGRSFANCAEARAAGYLAIPRGNPAYASHLDSNRNGIACE